MTNKPLLTPGNPAKIIYQIGIRGVLRRDWQDWFNGMLITAEGLSEDDPSTTFTCKVRDQAELIGIVNWLHEMNMVIEKVILLPK